MDLTIRDARAADAAEIAELLGELGYPADPAAVKGRLERLVIVGDRVVVAKSHRGQGVGRALVTAAEAEARQRGSGVFFLTTSDARGDAHGFYESLGLDQTGRRYGRTLSE